MMVPGASLRLNTGTGETSRCRWNPLTIGSDAPLTKHCTLPDDTTWQRDAL